MKKIISILFVLCLCMAASAQQHMKFMGIPLDGTVDNFALKLKAKGVTYNAVKSKDAGPGIRVFNGTFVGEDAMIVVFYNNKSKMVYSAAVELQYTTVESARTPFTNITEQLQQKYPNAKYKANLDQDGDANGLSFKIPDKTGTKSIGVILQTLNVDKSGYGCSIWLMYTDVDNFQKSEKTNNEDL